jgi:fatty-acyl-CoA synthase
MLNTGLTMTEAFHQIAVSRLNQEAIICQGASLTYGQTLDRANALARGLYALGIGKGDKIVCLLPPGAEFVQLFFATAELGAVIVPLNLQSRSRGITGVVRSAEPAALVTARPLDEPLLEEFSGLRQVISLGTMDGIDLSVDKVIALGKNSRPPANEVVPDDLLALLFTSGTTGSPKGTMHSHKSLIAPVVATTKLRELWMTRPSLKWLGMSAKALARYRMRLLRAAGRPQTFLSTAGWHSISGLMIMLQCLLMGDRLVVMPRFHPREALQLVEREGVSILIAIPMILQILLEIQKSDPYDTSSLLICGTGAAPCPPSLAREAQSVFGCAVHIGFGSTETAGGISATSLADSDERQAATVGRPMPGMEIKVVDAQRREVPLGEVGEVACRSESLMLGYYHAPDDTAEVMDEAGWYYTGDLGAIDEQGYLRIVGRKKDIIIRGGQNIYPEEIEAYLCTHPMIREAVVVGVPAAVGGENVWAFVLLEDGAKMGEQEVLEFCRKELEPYKIPSQVRIVRDLPRSETGKPQKFRLREEAIQLIQKGGVG